MFVRLCSLLFLVGCAAEEPDRLMRLARAWAAETAEISSPALTSTAVLAGLAGQLCIDRESGEWTGLVPGAAMPLPAGLLSALGNPTLAIVEADDPSAMLIVLSGVGMLDRSSGWLRISTSSFTDTFSVDVQALEGDESDAGDVLRLPAYGQAGLEVDTSCVNARSSVRGTALWTDKRDLRQDIGLPADADLGSAIALDAAQPYLPISGAMRWSSRIAGQERTVTTEDAVEIRIDDTGAGIPIGRWPTTVRGPGWSGTAIALIAP
jgi:hypothetical protein